jgi:hypothetical protein
MCIHKINTMKKKYYLCFKIYDTSDFFIHLTIRFFYKYFCK